MSKNLRRRPNKDEKLAACLLMLKRGTGEPLIPEPIRSQGSAAEICACVDWHHENYYATGGDTNPRMLTPLAPEDHDVRTRTIDIPRIAKTKRLVKSQEEFQGRLLAKGGGEAQPVRRKAKIQSRPFPKRKKVDDEYC